MTMLDLKTILTIILIESILHYLFDKTRENNAPSEIWVAFHYFIWIDPFIHSFIHSKLWVWGPKRVRKQIKWQRTISIDLRAIGNVCEKNQRLWMQCNPHCHLHIIEWFMYFEFSMMKKEKNMKRNNGILCVRPLTLKHKWCFAIHKFYIHFFLEWILVCRI